MIALQVSDAAARALLLGELIKLIETAAGMDELLTAGFEPKVIDSIRGMSVRDMREIANCMKNLSFCFEAKDLAGQLQRLGDKRQDREMCEYFVRNGAGRNMVAELWKLPLAEVTQMRRILLADCVTAGRPRLPKDLELRQRIHESWSAIGRLHSSDSPRRKIFRLHQLFPDLGIDSLCGVINEFSRNHDSGPSVRKTSSSHQASRPAAAVWPPAGPGKLNVS